MVNSKAMLSETANVTAQINVQKTAYPILFMISLIHLFNDAIQAVFPAIFPILKTEMGLSYTQLGLITFVLQFTSSIMQPVVGLYTDKKPSPYLLPLGMIATLIGMLTLGYAQSYAYVLVSVLFVGFGSAVFHPEGSRVSNMAAGARRGLAQSIFQVGGNGGQALAPIMTALIFVPLGQRGALWFTTVAAAAIIGQFYIARWYKETLKVANRAKRGDNTGSAQLKRLVPLALTVLVVLVFARSWYGASLSNYFAFDLMERFGLSTGQAQYYIFCFLAAGAIGTFLGGPIGDRFGRRNLIFLSMIGSAPLALLLPYCGPTLTYVVLIMLGFILLSGFSVMIVYAQDLMPGKIGTVSGIMIGLAFGMGAIASVAIGKWIDIVELNGLTINYVMKWCAILPLFGLLALLLPSDHKLRELTN
jgi:FSR family fosmidomycin resistance protein-like MFS transporter